jgi:hypothetical protein
MSSASEKRPAATLEEGVLKLMQQPGIMDAVMTIIEHANAKKKAKAAAKPVSSQQQKREALESQQLAAALAESAAMAASAAEAAATAERKQGASSSNAKPEEAERPSIARIPIGKANLPSLEEMQAAGYMGTASQMRSTWAWARDHVDNGTYQVWPTPTAGLQEALRFDAWGWPHAESTCEEWINMLTYWTAMREQMISGASRSQRAAVDDAFAGYSKRRS